MDDRELGLAPDRFGSADVPSAVARRWHVPALAVTLLLVVAVVGSLPFAVASMVAEFRGGDDTLYDLRDGREAAAGEEVDPGGADYLNVAIVAFDEAAGSATLAVSGNRSCGGECQAARMTFFALDDDASQRRGLAPFTAVALAAGEAAFSESIVLPVRGSPTRYPFDRYQMRLGVSVPPPDATAEAGPAAGPQDDGGRVFATLQNQLDRFVMTDPTAVDPASASSTTDPVVPTDVLALEFRRPVYLPVLAPLLVLLVAASSTMALATQAVDSLMLGVGGLILAVWGVRSVLVPSSLEAVTAVDLALSGVILLLLLGLALRTAFHLHRRAGLRLPRPRRRT